MAVSTVIPYHFEISIRNVLNQCFNELPHFHRHEMPLALTILVPECDCFSVVSVQSCVCDRGMPDVSGYMSCYPPFVCYSGFFWEMNVESLAIFLEKVVYEFCACVNCVVDCCDCRIHQNLLLKTVFPHNGHRASGIVNTACRWGTLNNAFWRDFAHLSV